ncbi:MAG TPA: type II toxin-antitoxin system HicB family antitoxin [Desulfuromonadales bacterium]|nr:type II toxin-antitoxin system HicB family antitoxin [Desulfuromonadales bacterium]
MLFPVVIHKDHESDYSVTIPDMPGCFTAGKTIEAAVLNIQDAVECHYTGEPELPVASSVDHWLNDTDYAGGTWLLVNVDLSRINVKSKRVNITLPENLLFAIDRYAETHHLTRSGFLAQAAGQYIHAK